jgi:4-diphosphocytidyl-2-C-methyl-D-erythritol kinase
VTSLPVLSSPAKLNLSLAVVGRRADGYHDLVSLVSPLALADTLTAELGPEGTASLSCDDPTLPVDASNLVLRAERVFRTRTGWKGGVRFHLAKRIPRGAGLGGGSSNATMALRALDQLAGTRLGDAVLAELAAELGSDCPLFLFSGPAVLRGRGERVQPVAPEVAARLAGRPVWLFKPVWGIETPWAFRRLAASGLGAYDDPAGVESRLAAWLADRAAPLESLPGNTHERVAFCK